MTSLVSRRESSLWTVPGTAQDGVSGYVNIFGSEALICMYIIFYFKFGKNETLSFKKFCLYRILNLTLTLTLKYDLILFLVFTLKSTYKSTLMIYTFKLTLILALTLTWTLTLKLTLTLT